MQHSIVFKKPGYYSAFPLILSNSNNKTTVFFYSSPFHDHFGENWAAAETKDFGSSWSVIDAKKNGDEIIVEGAIAAGRAFIIEFPNGDIISAGSIGWEKLDIGQKKIALENGWVVRDHPQEPDKFIYVNTPRLFVKRSKDKGRTWEKDEWIAEGFKWVLGFERGIVLENGSMLVPMYGLKYDGSQAAFVLRLESNGSEWSLNEIGRGDETALVEVSPNEVLSMTRHASTDSMTQGMYSGDADGYMLSNRSYDGGVTWSNQTKTNIWGFPAHLLKLSDDRILCSYGYRKSPMGIRALISDDAGHTWDIDQGYILRDDGGTISAKNEKANLTGGRSTSDVGYPVSLQLPDHSILTIYYITLDDGITHCASTTWMPD